jgi:hypothetical protein
MNLTNFLAPLDVQQRKEFCRRAGTKHTHLYQLLGGHRSPSLRLMWAMVRVSRRMHPSAPSQWLTLDDVHVELERARRRRARITKRSEQSASL